MSEHHPKSHFFEDLHLGMEASYSRMISGEDVETFARLSGDTNPVHLDEDYAARTIFKSRIVHGLLTASFISTVLGTRLPGAGAIYISQSLSFRAPVHPGDLLTAHVRVSDLIAAKRRVVLVCTCSVEEKLVLEGEAVLMVPSRNLV